MVKQIVLFVVLSVLLIGGVSAVYLYYEKSDNEPSSFRAPEQTSQPSSTQKRGTTDTGLQVQGANSGLNTPTPDNAILQPKDFEAYEEYADNKTALYSDIEQGTGQEAKSGDTVAMLYQGWLTNGELFDQSRINEQNQVEPFVFQLGAGQVIPGWEQGIVGMKEGGFRRLIIPAVAGYGQTGQGPIPPNSMLIFDVRLLELQRGEN